MNQGVLLTGATGFLGTEITTELLKHTEGRIYVFVHAENEEDAIDRLRSAWKEHRDLCEHIGERICPIPGDITYYDLRMAREHRELLIHRVDWIIHAAAETNLLKEKGEIRSVNIDGTQYLLELAEEIHRHHGLRKFAYVSSAYVAQARRGVIFEKEDLPGEYTDYCEESRAEAEMLVKNSGLSYCILRPSLIVGNSRTGRIYRFHALYEAILLLLTRPMPVLPISAKQKLNIVPVDYVADSVVKLALDSRAKDMAFHLTASNILAPYAYELRDFVRDWAKENLGVRHYSVFFPVRFLRTMGNALNRKIEEKEESRRNVLLSMAPYFFTDLYFDRANTDKFLGSYDLRWQDYFPVLMEYACRKNFYHQTQRTVFQISRERRESSYHPVSYHNMTEYGVEHLSGQEMNRRIRDIASAMENIGIEKGSRVALTGINSVNYAAVNAAIGLLGAVSVPVSRTAFLSEIELALESCGTRWFFIGDREVLERAGQISAPVRMISFLDAREALESVMSWEDFLSFSNGDFREPVLKPEDPATIRCCISEDGDARGIIFTYQQLQWLGETMSGLLPWKKRNRSMRYLSFLPCQEDIEGMMAAYAPYFMRGSVDFYYLNDVETLQASLQEVRPTMFLAHPDFYGALWLEMMGNRVGREYLDLQPGARRFLLGRFLKWYFLRKNGLHKCRQLLVEGETVSEILLNNYHEMGIEVYRTYGLPQAPMITMNRLGDNMIPSIGTPLPDTEIRIEADGELVVRGPQVSPGFYGEERAEDETLRTGLLGGMGKTRHVFVTGRKNSERGNGND